MTKKKVRSIKKVTGAENVPSAPPATNEPVPLSKAFRGIINLLLAGQYTGTHSQLVVESIGLLQAMIQNEEKAEENKPVAAEAN